MAAHTVSKWLLYTASTLTKDERLGVVDAFPAWVSIVVDLNFHATRTLVVRHNRS